MAVIYRFPVLVWQDPQGAYTASLLEWDAPAGIGSTQVDAVEQIHDFLEWGYQKQLWQFEPDFLDPILENYRAPIRPEYQHDGRRFPCDESFVLRLPVVHGRQEHGLFQAVVPTLNLRFYYYEASSLRSLVTHYVQQRLEGVTPAELARYLPPARVMLDQIVLTLRERVRKEPTWKPSLPSLEAAAEPLGDPRLRKQFVRPWERDQIVADVVRRLDQEKANVLLVGDAGAGKTTVLVEAVRHMERKSDEDHAPGAVVPARRYWQTSGGRLIAGMKYLGQWEERCEEIIDDLGRIGGVLCIENLLDLVREGGGGPMDSVANFFLPYLQRGELRMVAEASPAELEACRRLLPGLADVFQVLVLPPFTRAQAVNVLQHLTDSSAQNLHMEVGRGVVDQVYHLHRRFLPYRAFPGQAAVFLNQLFEQVRQTRTSRRETLEVTMDQVVTQFIRQTGLPELFLRDDIPLEREEVFKTFQSQIIGQPDACTTAANLVLTFKAGMNDPHRPIAVLLFCGPTGVGKTELARGVARYFFGNGEQGDRLVRLDMSEYSGFGAADRLIRQPNGQPSDLIRRMRQQPFVVLLLDEIEKAAAEVFDVLLGVFDEGRLTDPFGRLTTFRSAIIIMTSNLGAGKQESFGFRATAGASAQLYEGEALAFFRPEFFNRIDGVVTFQPLSAESIRAITRKELDEIGRREGLTRSGLRVEWSEALVEFLAREGFDPRLGARPLQRTLEQIVVAPLARYLLEQEGLRAGTLRMELEEGSGEVRIDLVG
jgi:ATP-dependent Clp protease ATP-binding subunit ClpC